MTSLGTLDTVAKAIVDGDSVAVGKWIESGSFDVNTIFESLEVSPLLLAVQHGHAAVVDVLLKAGADIEFATRDGETACHAAAERGNANVLALLLARRPNLSVPGENGKTLFESAVEGYYEQCVLLLLEAGAPLDHNHSVCHAAAISTDVIRALLKRGVDVGALCDESRRTPLHIVVRAHDVPESDDCGALTVIEMLVNVCGADLEARDLSGKTITHNVAWHGRDAELRWLVSAGADIASVDNGGWTPLHFACWHGHTRCALTLLAAGADAGARSTAHGNTPCHLAVTAQTPTGDDAILYALIAFGADFDATNAVGRSARQILFERRQRVLPTEHDEVDIARRRIATMRLDFVRHRALQVCIGLHSRGLDALQMCEILLHSCGPVAPLVAFHHWWAIATTVKHFQ